VNLNFKFAGLWFRKADTHPALGVDILLVTIDATLAWTSTIVLRWTPMFNRYGLFQHFCP